MNSKTLKLIACISMVIDHVGLVIFDDSPIFRILGRIAFPIFAFFIGEGCLHTKNIKRYFLRLFGFGSAIQLGLVAYTLLLVGRITPKAICLHMNVMLTFSLSVAVCGAYLALERCVREGRTKKETARAALVFAAVLAVLFCLGIFFTHSREWVGYRFSLDYSTVGVLLPLFAIMTRDPDRRLWLFGLGIVLVCLAYTSELWYTWFALLSLPLIASYNGERGRVGFRYGFYIFYPLHLVIIYLIGAFV